jgi:hypothetical protein
VVSSQFYLSTHSLSLLFPSLFLLPGPPPPVFPSLCGRDLGAGARPRPPARGRPGPIARRPTLGLVSFKFSLMSVLSRALRRATIQFKFVFINVLRRMLRRATIHFKFVFIKVRCRALRRATIRFKFSSVDVSRRAFRHTTLNVCL